MAKTLFGSPRRAYNRMVIPMATSLGRPQNAPSLPTYSISKSLLRGLALFLLGILVGFAPAWCADKSVKAFFKIQSVVVPVQTGLQRDAANIGFARAGETYSVVTQYQGWTQIQFKPELRGWVPESSGQYVSSDTSYLPMLLLLLGVLVGLMMGGFLTLVVIRWQKNRQSSLELAAMLRTAQSRRGKRILAVLPSWPSVHQILGGDSRPMDSLLQEWGYTLFQIQSTEEVLAQARQFVPNILMALSTDAKKLELVLGRSATLANTPVVYLGAKPPRLTEGNGIRLHWMLAGNDKALSETLTAALRRSPKTIRHSVRSEGIRGELDGGGLWEVLHFLAIMRKTGKLSIETANLIGEIRLMKGDILFARMGDLSDAEAVSGMLNLDAGKFAFVESKGVPHGKGMSTEKLLLDWAKRRDEIHDGTGT
jgi:hypothetical protein